MAAADRHLLFGLLALQTGIVNQGQLVAAFQAWSLDKSRSLADYLEAGGGLDTDDRAAVEALVARHLKRHGGDVEKSLAGIPAGPSTRESLEQLGEPEVVASLGHIGTKLDGTLGEAGDRTASYAVGTATSEGQRFRVLRPHARGGLGAVFVALDAELNREVALKQILDHHADDPASRQRFLIEAQITGGLEHPGIVPVYGLGAHADGRPYYAMRFIKGDSLKEAIERFHADEALRNDPGRRSLELRKLLRRFTDVCNAIDYAHSRGVLHRDIKPGNIIVGKYGETLVVDWGLAKPLRKVEAGADSGERTLMPSPASGSAETLPGSALGTPAYMSPEQARGELDRLGPRSDVFSLGSTLYCVLTGRPPFGGEDVGELLRRVQRCEFGRPRQLDPSIDRSMEAVCLRAMASEPEDRYASTRALAEDVERWMADEPVSARREPMSARLARWARRHRTAVAAIGLSLATAVLLLSVSNILVNHARSETARALDRVREEQGRTADALRRADANFRRARQAVEDYFTTVSDEVLPDEPGMQTLRTKLLRSALKYHEMFLTEHADAPEVEAELAESHRRVAIIGAYTGAKEDPLPHLQIARERFEKLARQYPDRPEYRRQIALTLAEVGAALADRKPQRDEAIQAYRDAIAIHEELLKEQPANETTLDDLATTLCNLALTRAQQQGGSGEAIQITQRARDILKRLISLRPDSLRPRIQLAELHGNMYNNLVGNLRRQDEALQSSDDALAVYKELLEHAPQSPRFKTQLGMLHDNRGLLYSRRGKVDEAMREAREARRILLEVVRANPENQRYRGLLAGACARLGLNLTQAGRSEEALGPLCDACDAFERYLEGQPGDMSFQATYLGTLSALGSSLGRLGRYDESISVFERAVAIATPLCRKDPNNIFLRGDSMVCKFNLAVSMTRAGRRHAEAVAAFEEAQAMGKELFGGDGWSHSGSNSASAHLLLAYSLREIGRDQDAERALAKARASMGSDAESLYDLARYEARGARRLAAVGGDPRAVAALEQQALLAMCRAVDRGFADVLSVQEFGTTYQLSGRPELRLILLDAAFPADVFATADLEQSVPATHTSPK
jgi:serine/threonine-protein kinase